MTAWPPRHFRPLSGGSRSVSSFVWPGFAWTTPSTDRPTLSIRPADAAYRVPPSLAMRGCRTLNLLAIAYASNGLGLGPD